MGKRVQIILLISVLIFIFVSVAVYEQSNSGVSGDVRHGGIDGSINSPHPTADGDVGQITAEIESIGSIAINGFEVEVTTEQERIAVAVQQGTNFNQLPLDYELADGWSFEMNGIELASGSSYKFESIQQVELVSDRQTLTYELVIYELDQVVDSGLPLVIINTEGQRPIVDRVNEIDSVMTIIDGSSMTYGEGLYSGPITIRGRGNSSWEMPKKSYKISPPNNVPILDMPRENDWVLIANYADKTLMRNYVAYAFADSLGMAYSPRMRHVELYINEEYIGNYLIGEQIKIDSDRLDLAKLSNTDNSAPNITGGYVIEKDWEVRLDEGDIAFTTDRIHSGDLFAIKRPSPRNITQPQVDYITDYFRQAEAVLYSPDFLDEETGYRQYFEVESLIDWYLVNELFKNVDSNFGTSVFLHKDRGGPIAFGPVWDFDLGAGNANYSAANRPTGYHVKNAVWVNRFFEDPAFVQQLNERWQEIRDDQIPALLDLIRQTEQQLAPSAEANFKRWDILGKYVWPNADGYEERTTYGSEVDYLIDWLEERIAWLDEAFPEL